jgi:hypothetical protein
MKKIKKIFFKILKSFKKKNFVIFDTIKNGKW